MSISRSKTPATTAGYLIAKETYHRVADALKQTSLPSPTILRRASMEEYSIAQS
jgi:hypothetical protein